MISYFKFFSIFVVFTLAFISLANAQKTGEEQRHGVDFEEWVRETLFDGYQAPYTQKWDIEASSNTNLPAPYRGLPVSVKCAKAGRPIDLADAMRQRSINGSFVIILGLWNQRTPQEKWIEEMLCVRVDPAAWEALWGSLSYDDIAALDAGVKDRSRSVAEARAFAVQWKREHRDSGSVISINYKIDERGQRRVQCSIPLETLLSAAAASERGTNLFNHAFPNPIPSSARALAAPAKSFD
jgi:hypothetical protein